MKSFERRTARIYNTEPLLSMYETTVTKVGDNYLELAATVAYPEGGGQEADHGVISKMGLDVQFHDVKKVYTNPVQLADFPSIDANGVIWHYVCDHEQDGLKKFSVGDCVSVHIDEERRSKLSISHTASHILYMAIDRFRSGVVEHVFGCHIKPDGARFDFYAEKFTEEHIKAIELMCNQIVQDRLPVNNVLHADNDDAKYWECQGVVIPCGGTHVSNTGFIHSMKIKRKGLGAGKERIMCTFEADVQAQVNSMQGFSVVHDD